MERNPVLVSGGGRWGVREWDENEVGRDSNPRGFELRFRILSGGFSFVIGNRYELFQNREYGRFGFERFRGRFCPSLDAKRAREASDTTETETESNGYKFEGGWPSGLASRHRGRGVPGASHQPQPVPETSCEGAEHGGKCLTYVIRGAAKKFQ